MVLWGVDNHGISWWFYAERNSRFNPVLTKHTNVNPQPAHCVEAVWQQVTYMFLAIIMITIATVPDNVTLVNVPGTVTLANVLATANIAMSQVLLP